MDYSVSLLTTAADCQAAINMANAEKETLLYKKTGLSRQRKSAVLNAANIGAELISVTAELEYLRQVLETVPEGPFKDLTLANFKKADYKKFLLEGRKENYGALSLIGREYDIACIDKAITETDDYIAFLEHRMEEVD